MTAVAAADRGRTARAVAWTSGGPSLVEVTVAPPGPGEALLRLRWCGLCGTDLFKLAHRSVPEGTVLGHELVATVEALGAGVGHLAVGDRVVVTHHVACGSCALCRNGAETQCPTFKENLLEPGGFSDLLLVREPAVRHAWRVPSGVSDAAATFLEPAACVLRGVDRAAVPGEDSSAAVLGAGAMGLLHLLVLRALRPGIAVVVSDPVAPRRALALGLGAAAAVAPDELAGAVEGVTGGLGVDAVFDTVGGAGPLAQALQVSRPGGAAVLFAHGAEGERAGFLLNPFFKSERRVVATYSGGVAEQARVAGLLGSGLLDPEPLVSHRMPLDRFDEAVELARTRRALKVLLEP